MRHKNEAQPIKPIKVRGVTKAYEQRYKDQRHPGEIHISFDGTWKEFKKRVRLFGQKTAEYFPSEDRATYYPLLNGGWRSIAADFKYCYEKFREEILAQGWDSDWDDLQVYFREAGINEVYDSIGKDPNLRLLYNIPVHLIFDSGHISGNELKVLMAFKANAKNIHDGVRVCGWSYRKLGSKIGMTKDTVCNCITKLEQKGFLKLMPSLSVVEGPRKKYSYQVMNC